MKRHRLSLSPFSFFFTFPWQREAGRVRKRGREINQEQTRLVFFLLLLSFFFCKVRSLGLALARFHFTYLLVRPRKRPCLRATAIIVRHCLSIRGYLRGDWTANAFSMEISNSSTGLKKQESRKRNRFVSVCMSLSLCVCTLRSLIIHKQKLAHAPQPGIAQICQCNAIDIYIFASLYLILT